MKKYITGSNPFPVIKTHTKDIVDGHHGLHIPAQPNPINRNTLFLISRYRCAIFRPTSIVTKTKIRLNKPLRKSTGLKANVKSTIIMFCVAV